MKPHKHAELIKAWADGAEIEWVYATKGDGTKLWAAFPHPVWDESHEYRIKPEPKPDVVLYANVSRCKPHVNNGFYSDISFAYDSPPTEDNPANLKLTFDGETGELWDAEVLK